MKFLVSLIILISLQSFASECQSSIEEKNCSITFQKQFIKFVKKEQGGYLAVYNPSNKIIFIKTSKKIKFNTTNRSFVGVVNLENLTTSFAGYETRETDVGESLKVPTFQLQE